jgi:hypothetical protein
MELYDTLGGDPPIDLFETVDFINHKVLRNRGSSHSRTTKHRASKAQDRELEFKNKAYIIKLKSTISNYEQ